MDNVLNQNEQVDAPWAAKGAQVLVLIKDLALSLTAQNATREKFDEHLLNTSLYLSGALMSLPVAELDQILAEIKVLFDEAEAKLDGTNQLVLTIKKICGFFLESNLTGRKTFPKNANIKINNELPQAALAWTALGFLDAGLR